MTSSFFVFVMQVRKRWRNHQPAGATIQAKSGNGAMLGMQGLNHPQHNNLMDA
jgi:hypothetical protein